MAATLKHSLVTIAGLAAVKKPHRRGLLLFCLLFFTAARAGMKDSVYAYILASDIKHPEVVLKQAILETGLFQSKFLMKKNNLFGFRATKKYMHFETWQDCIQYYKKWQDANYTNPKEDYYVFLKRIRYSRTETYVPTLMRIDLRRSGGAYSPPVLGGVPEVRGGKRPTQPSPKVLNDSKETKTKKPSK